jgi:uncharacterized protein
MTASHAMASTERRRLFLDVLPRVETRAFEDGTERPVIAGLAVVFDSWTTLYEGKRYVAREVVRRGAFANALKEKQDVRALFNHDANLVLGRTTSGTLRLTENEQGLESVIVPPDTQAARDVLELIRRGDVSGMSFAFTPRTGGQKVTTREEDDREVDERELTDLDLYDVSVVTYPAYEATRVGLRAMGLDPEAVAMREMPSMRLGTPKRDRWARYIKYLG